MTDSAVTLEAQCQDEIKVPIPFMARWAVASPVTMSTDMRNPDTSTHNPSTEDNDT